MGPTTDSTDNQPLEASTYDSVDQLLLVLDQLAVCRDLLLTGDPARSRMALILLDNLADVLIYRHNRDLIGGAEDRYSFRKRFSKKERAALQNSFHKRLELAQEPVTLSWLSGGPLTDQDGARVLRVVHFYRNSAYHRDSHKPALVGVLGRILFATVCRMTVESYRPKAGFGSSGRDFATQVQRLNAYLAPPGIDTGRMATLVFRDRAEEATNKLSESLGVELPAARSAFAEDLNARADAALELATELATSGPGERQVREGIGWADFWGQFSGDSELIHYMDESEALGRQASGAEDPVWERARAAEQKYVQRLELLRGRFQPQISLDYIDEARAVAARLATASSMPEVLEEYEVADRQMTSLENCLWKVADEWESHLDLQMQEWKETHSHPHGEIESY